MRRAALALVVLAGCDLFLSADEQLAVALAGVQASPPPTPVAGVTFLPSRLVLTRQVVRKESREATIFAHADADGDLGGVKVSYLGPERLRLVREDGWRLDGPPLPALAAILEALRARQSALAARDVAAYARLLDDAYSDDPGVDRAEAERRTTTLFATGAPFEQLIPTAWRIRAERDTATVREEYPALPPEAGQPRGRMAALIQLRRRGDVWRFAAGLY